MRIAQNEKLIPGASATRLPLLRTPRPDPSKRDSRTRLPPWVFDVKALPGPGVLDSRPGEPVADEFQDPLPSQVRLLAASRQRALPEDRDVVAERRECPTIRRHG